MGPVFGFSLGRPKPGRDDDMGGAVKPSGALERMTTRGALQRQRQRLEWTCRLLLCSRWPARRMFAPSRRASLRATTLAARTVKSFSAGRPESSRPRTGAGQRKGAREDVRTDRGGGRPKRPGGGGMLPSGIFPPSNFLLSRCYSESNFPTFGLPALHQIALRTTIHMLDCVSQVRCAPVRRG